eukprot:m.39801 g.39801  ORF g.39801 m.39801 type:complete len:183 (+) comp9593_c0_seq3:334-882(+)
MDSCNNFFVSPMDTSEDAIERFLDDLIPFAGQLPDLKQARTFSVYSLSSGFGSHESIVFSSDGKNYLTVELGFEDAVDGVRRIRPICRPITGETIAKLKYIGTTMTTAERIIGAALDTMASLGTYVKGFTDCQRYCRLVLQELRLVHPDPHDGDLVVKIAGGIILCLVIAILTNKARDSQKN